MTTSKKCVDLLDYDLKTLNKVEDWEKLDLSFDKFYKYKEIVEYLISKGVPPPTEYLVRLLDKCDYVHIEYFIEKYDFSKMTFTFRPITQILPVTKGSPITMTLLDYFFSEYSYRAPYSHPNLKGYYSIPFFVEGVLDESYRKTENYYNNNGWDFFTTALMLKNKYKNIRTSNIFEDYKLCFDTLEGNIEVIKNAVKDEKIHIKNKIVVSGNNLYQTMTYRDYLWKICLNFLTNQKMTEFLKAIDYYVPEEKNRDKIVTSYLYSPSKFARNNIVPILNPDFRLSDEDKLVLSLTENKTVDENALLQAKNSGLDLNKKYKALGNRTFVEVFCARENISGIKAIMKIDNIVIIDHEDGNGSSIDSFLSKKLYPNKPYTYPVTKNGDIDWSFIKKVAEQFKSKVFIYTIEYTRRFSYEIKINDTPVSKEFVELLKKNNLVDAYDFNDIAEKVLLEEKEKENKKMEEKEKREKEQREMKEKEKEKIEMERIKNIQERTYNYTKRLYVMRPFFEFLGYSEFCKGMSGKLKPSYKKMPKEKLVSIYKEKYYNQILDECRAELRGSNYPAEKIEEAAKQIADRIIVDITDILFKN